jgi:hypothetical protein
MRRNRPVISSAKVRGLIKKNDIHYVDRCAATYGYSFARGINVWQLCDTIYLRPYGSIEEQDSYIAKLNEALAEFGLVALGTSSTSSFEIKAVA